MNELFQIEPVKSPRLRWMDKHQIKTHHNPEMIESPWCAWLGSNDKDGIPIVPELCGYGMLEGDALVDLAKSNQIKLWNEE